MIPGIPYDAEVEYLESTGTQWIDTGLVQGADTRYEVKVAPLSSGNCMIGCGAETGIVYGWRLSFHSTGVYQDWGNDRISGPVPDFGHVYVASVERGKLVLEDLTAGTTNTYTGPQSAASLPTSHMFLYRDPSISAAMGSLRFYYVRIWQGGILVRDFIPVRVGQVGYMYDRVTKKLFSNQGTGEFSWGADVARPVMGLKMYHKFYTAHDYIQDGLVAMWDGEWNAGPGVHDPNATVWKDLSGNGWDLNLVSGMCTWNLDGLKFTRSSSSPVGTNSVALPYNNNNNYFEIIFDNPSPFSDGWNILQGGGRVGDDCAINRINIAFISNFSLRGIDFAGSPYFRWDLSSSSTLGAGKYQMTCSNSLSSMNGVPGTLRTTAQKYSGGSNRGVELFGKLNRTLHSFRVYNHTPTAQEIAANYAVDKARFNLPEVTA